MPLAGDRRRSLDAALVAWILAWCILGFWVGREVHRLGDVTGSVRGVGGAVVSAGDAIKGLQDLPIVGGTVSKPGAGIAAAGRDAQASADEARTAGTRLGILLGLAVALIPPLPLLAVSLPPRLALERDRRALAGRGLSDALLAQRAIANLPLHRLARVSDDPLGDLAAGDFTALAAA